VEHAQDPEAHARAVQVRVNLFKADGSPESTLSCYVIGMSNTSAALAWADGFGQTHVDIIDPKLLPTKTQRAIIAATSRKGKTQARNSELQSFSQDDFTPCIKAGAPYFVITRGPLTGKVVDHAMRTTLLMQVKFWEQKKGYIFQLCEEPLYCSSPAAVFPADRLGFLSPELGRVRGTQARLADALEVSSSRRPVGDRVVTCEGQRALALKLSSIALPIGELAVILRHTRAALGGEVREVGNFLKCLGQEHTPLSEIVTCCCDITIKVSAADAACVYPGRQRCKYYATQSRKKVDANFTEGSKKRKRGMKATSKAARASHEPG
jgi:hypothetical protein